MALESSITDVIVKICLCTDNNAQFSFQSSDHIQTIIDNFINYK
jgi:hypothetical protein